MGHKNVCFNCRKSFNLGTDFDKLKESKCPNCSSIMTIMVHRFRPPKTSDINSWKVVDFLVNQGFIYQHIYDDDIIPTYVPYPKTMKSAKEFVIKYKEQRIEVKHSTN